MFIKPSQMIPVTHEESPGDVIYIRAKMGLGVEAAINDELVSLQVDLNNMTDDGMGKADLKIGQKRQWLVELKHNIKKWEGPSFTNPETGDAIPFSKAQVELIEDFDHPLIKKVLDEIKRRNEPATKHAPDAKTEAHTDPKEPVTSES